MWLGCNPHGASLYGAAVTLKSSIQQQLDVEQDLEMRP